MSAVRAGRAFIEMFLEDKDLRKGLARAGGKLKDFGKAGMAATAPIIAGLGASVAAFTSVGSALDDMSQRTGIGAQALSEFSFAAMMSGTDISVFEGAIRKMQRGIVDAESGTGKLHSAMSALGLDVNKIKNLAPEKQFEILSSAIASVEDPTLKAALAQDVFGKSGTALLPMLTEGAGGLAAMRQQASDLGLTMDSETAAAAGLLGDKIDIAKQQIVAIGVQIGAAVAGPLTDFLTGIHSVLGGVISWIRENPKMVKAVAAVATGIAAASAAAIALGTVLAIISAHPIIAALTAIAALVIAIATYFGFASDGADEFSGKLAEVKKESGIDSASTSSRNEQAKAVQEQLQAAIATTSTPSNSAAGPAESMLAQQSLAAVEQWTEKTARGIERLIQLVQSDQGGLLVGTG